MNKKIAIVAIPVVVVVVFLLTRSSGDSGSSETPRKGRTVPTLSSEEGDRVREKISRRRRPQLEDPEVANTKRDPVRVYTTDDGRVVRDHRKNPPPRRPKGDTVNAPPPVQPKTLVAVRRAIRPLMKECIERFTEDAPEAAKATAVLTVSIAAEQLKIDSLDVRMNGEWDAAAFRECVTEKVLGHEQVVAGAKDVATHQMTFPYAL